MKTALLAIVVALASLAAYGIYDENQKKATFEQNEKDNKESQENRNREMDAELAEVNAELQLHVFEGIYGQGSAESRKFKLCLESSPTLEKNKKWCAAMTLKVGAKIRHDGAHPIW